MSNLNKFNITEATMLALAAQKGVKYRFGDEGMRCMLEYSQALLALATPPVASGALPELHAQAMKAAEAWVSAEYTSTKSMCAGGPTHEKALIKAENAARKAINDLAAAAAPNTALVMGWQPIETAPRDGSMILLGRAEDEACDRGAICTPGRWHEEDHDGPDNMGHDAGFMDIEYQEFSWGRSFGNPDYMGGTYQPTHWMPLPTAPSKP